MVTTQGTGEFTNSITASGSLIAGSGTFSESLTVSGVPVFTGFVTKFIPYSGTGVSGTQVELTGINRAHGIYTHRFDLIGFNRWPNFSFPDGETGDIVRRNTNGGVAQDLNLNAPNAGGSQILTINTVSNQLNEVDVAYRLHVVGVAI